jgi:hypothetical protein
VQSPDVATWNRFCRNEFRYCHPAFFPPLIPLNYYTLAAVHRCAAWRVEDGKRAVSKITDKLIFDMIKQHYRPYDTHEAFDHGFSAYLIGDSYNPHDPETISAQAWDLGVEAAIRYKRATMA